MERTAVGEHPRCAHGMGWKLVRAPERNPDRTVAAELGELRESNQALRLAADHEEFVAWVIAHEAPAPETYPKIKATNVGLVTVSQAEANILEAGRNECAIV